MNTEGLDDDSFAARQQHITANVISPESASEDSPKKPADHVLVDNCPASHTIITTLSDELGIDPLEMQPLYEVVDPDALDALFSSVSDRGTSVTVTFEYCGHAVTVTSEGTVTIQ